MKIVNGTAWNTEDIVRIVEACDHVVTAAHDGGVQWYSNMDIRVAYSGSTFMSRKWVGTPFVLHLPFKGYAEEKSGIEQMADLGASTKQLPQDRVIQLIHSILREFSGRWLAPRCDKDEVLAHYLSQHGHYPRISLRLRCPKDERMAARAVYLQDRVEYRTGRKNYHESGKERYLRYAEWHERKAAKDANKLAADLERLKKHLETMEAK